MPRRHRLRPSPGSYTAAIETLAEVLSMAKRYDEIGKPHRAFMARQRIFFVASAAADRHGTLSHVNVSPRGTNTFRYIDSRQVAYLDLTGSGNETAAHIRAGGRLTIMFCAVEGPPIILRLYGRGAVHRPGTTGFDDMLATYFDGHAPVGARQIVSLSIDLVQTSCGYGVPFFDYRGERGTLDQWAERKGRDGIEAYWHEKNVASIDGLPTGVLD